MSNNDHNIKKQEYDYNKLNIQIYGTIFYEREKYGDFKHMIKTNKYNDALFIYNDNEEQYNSCSCVSGGGNAVIRSYNIYNKTLKEPLSFGIPTGTLNDGGYEQLNLKNKKIIDDSIKNIYYIITKYNKKRIFYSSKDFSGILGTGIFQVSQDVLKYITKKLYSLSEHDPIIIQQKPKDLFDDFDENNAIDKN